MHGAVGTAIGGVCTTVGEPQNLLIAGQMGWNFTEFFLQMAPVTMPVVVVGFLTCVILEGLACSVTARRCQTPFLRFCRNPTLPNRPRDRVAVRMQLLIQAIAAVFLVVALAFHWAEVGLIGLAVIVIQTAFNGVIEEHRIGRAFEEALPFTALLIVFFVIVAVIHEQHLFTPVIVAVLNLEPASQPSMLYLANGVLSAISDNVFVATVYIDEVGTAFKRGEIPREHLEHLAVAINTGTNIPSIATPNGQAAFLFLLTSAIAPLVRLSYARMALMALPYTITMGVTGFFCVRWLL